MQPLPVFPLWFTTCTQPVQVLPLRLRRPHSFCMVLKKSAFNSPYPSQSCAGFTISPISNPQSAIINLKFSPRHSFLLSFSNNKSQIQSSPYTTRSSSFRGTRLVPIRGYLSAGKFTTDEHRFTRIYQKNRFHPRSTCTCCLCKCQWIIFFDMKYTFEILYQRCDDTQIPPPAWRKKDIMPFLRASACVDQIELSRLPLLLPRPPLERTDGRTWCQPGFRSLLTSGAFFVAFCNYV